MRQHLVRLSIPTALLAFAMPTFGGVIQALGAGPLPASAEDLTLLYPQEIDGSLPGLNDVNMFKLNIFYPGLFSAIVEPILSGIPDTELFLFDSGGNAVYMNDDISGSNTLSCLPSVTSNPCPTGSGGLGPRSAGAYYLAITRALQLPQDAGSNYLFTYLITDFDSTGVYGGTGAVAQWDGLANTGANFDLNTYRVELTGTAPEPGSALLVGAMAGAWFLRRRFHGTTRRGGIR